MSEADAYICDAECAQFCVRVDLIAIALSRKPLQSDTLSEKATIAIPTAGRISATTSLGATRGRPATGQSAGMVPTTSIPLVCNDSATTPMVAASTAIKGPGNLRCPTPEARATAAEPMPPRPSSASGYWSILRANDRIRPTNSSPETGVPVILPSWLAIIRIAMPVM